MIETHHESDRLHGRIWYPKILLLAVLENLANPVRIDSEPRCWSKNLQIRTVTFPLGL